MDGESPWRRQGARPRWPHIRPSAVCAVAGGFLTLVTMALCISNAVSTQQAIALAFPAALITLGGWISIIVPDALIAWRRGFQQGWNAAMDCPAPDHVIAATRTVKTGICEATVTDLAARRRSRLHRRTRSGTSQELRRVETNPGRARPGESY
jgi:hypothetical protein